MDLKQLLKTTEPKIKLLKKKGIYSAIDLLNYLPRAHEVLTFSKSLGEMDLREKVIFKMEITTIEQKITHRTRKKILTVKGITELNEKVEIVYFGRVYYADKYRSGDVLLVSGKVKHEYGTYKMNNAELDFYNDSKTIKEEEMVSIYVESEGLSSEWIRSKMKLVLEKIDELPVVEFIPESVLKEEGMIGYKEALYNYHLPASKEKLNAAKKRLAFNELFLLQMSFLDKRIKYQKFGGIVIGDNNDEEISRVVKLYLNNLDFDLTNDQKIVLYEILKDFSKNRPMLRLLQGDVGSGKTIVAEIASFYALQNGYQVVFLVPTESLARQHYKKISEKMNQYEFQVDLLIGSTKKSDKKIIKENLRLGKSNMVIGTHAIIQDDLSFNNLGFVIVDEQHKFGVEQRKILSDHGNPHILHMTATPIPRTLALAFAGDQDVSVIREKPNGRKDIITRIINKSKRDQMYTFLKSEIAKGRKVYVVCPLIESSDKEGMDEVKAVTDEFEILKQIFEGTDIGLLHGKLSSEDKKLVLEEFAFGKIHILVSTTVIEVGIDVPDATIILIEGAERFGLSQLHQLRGRVGRNDIQSYCFLSTTNPDKGISDRLKVMEKTNDGFVIAKKDLELRGPGEVYGLKQSGIPDLQVASYYDYNLLKTARKWAEEILEEDITLAKYPKLRDKVRENEIIRA